jgi:hypothetical protein
MVAALTTEINQIQEENKRPGWSAWALQGGIATFLWLAVNEFGPKSNLQTIGIVFLFGSLLGDLLLSACQYLNRLGNSKRSQIRYQFLSDNPNASPAMLVFTIVRYTALLLVYNSLSFAFRVPSFTLYCVGVVALCVVIFPLRSARALALKKELPTKTEHWVTGIILLWCGFLIYRLFLMLLFSDTDIRISDYRLGILLVGILYLSSLLVSGEKEKPIANTLKEIRRELAFGKISSEEAAKEADVVLSGLTATAAIEHKLTELSSKFHGVILSYEKLIAECQAANSILKSFETMEDQLSSKWKEDARKVAILIDSCETQKTVSQQLLSAVYFKTKSTLQSIGNLHASNPVPKPESVAIWLDMKSKMGKMFELSNSSGPLLEDVKARYKAISSKNQPLDG